MKLLIKTIHIVYFVVIIVSISLASPLVYLSNAPGSVCAFWRLFFSSIILFPLWIHNRRIHYLELIAGLSLGLHMVLWMESLFYIPIGVSTALVVTYPLYSILLEKYILREELSLKTIIGAITSFSGILLFLSEGFIGELHIVGIIYALIGGFAASIYFITGRYLRSRLRISLSEYVFPVYCISSIIALLYNAFTGRNIHMYNLYTYLVFLLLALIPMFGGHTLINYLLRYYKASILTSLALLEPVGSSLLAYILFNQSLSLIQSLGIMIVLMGRNL